MSTTPQPIASAPAQAPATPDLGGLATPGPAAAPNPASLQTQAAPFEATSQAAYKKAADIANQPAEVAKPVPHARLLSMVQGLADGLSGFGTAIATGGKEGGAPEVQQLQAARQQQKIQAQAASTAQRNAQIQQQLMVGDTNHKLAQNVFLMGTLPTELAKSHVELQSAQQGVIGQAQDIRTKALQDFIQTGDTAAYNETLSKLGAAAGDNTPAGAAPSTAPNAASVSAGPAAGTVPPVALANWKNATDSAISAYPNDAKIKESASILTNPDSTSQQMAQAANAARNRMTALDAGADSRTKQEAAALGARPKDLNDATGRLTQAQADYKNNPSPETKNILDSAKAAQSEFMTADRQQKQIAQDVQNGDPSVIGAAMADGTYAPSQVLSARSMSKPFYAKVVAAANEAAKANGAPEILGPNGQHTGQYFDAAKAEAQYKYSTNVQTQNTLNKILTLNEPGGDLDILKGAITALPKMDQKTVNRIFNAGATEFGSPEATNYHMALYNMASLLAQVQTGGVPTEGEIQTQLNLMNAANSKGQLDGALQTAKRDIGARGTSMVANNPYLRQAYPTIANSNLTVTAPDGSIHTFKDQQGVDTFKKLAGIQ